MSRIPQRLRYLVLVMNMYILQVILLMFMNFGSKQMHLSNQQGKAYGKPKLHWSQMEGQKINKGFHETKMNSDEMIRNEDHIFRKRYHAKWCLSATLFNIYGEWFINKYFEGLGDFEL